MGLMKAWKEAKALAASGRMASNTPGSQTRPGPRSMMAGLETVMWSFLGPLVECEAPERGDPLPGTEPGVLDALDPVGLQAGMAALRGRDSAFDPQSLTTFADQVYVVVAAAWGSGDSASVRPVMADGLWNPMAAAIMGGGATGAGSMFSRFVGQSTLTGVWAGSSYDSALFSVAVSADALTGGQPPPPGFSTHWTEDWLFQRSVTPGGEPMMVAASCPSCGAPTATDDFGLCSHCHAAVPVLTTGWLLTTVRSHNPMVETMRDRITAQVRANPAQMAAMPDGMVRLLPVDVVTQIDPSRAAALHLRPR